MSSATTTLSSYEPLAQEYYETRHVTSRNFDKTTSAYLRRHSVALPLRGLVLDLGAGAGAATRYCSVNPDRIVQVDISKSMLLLKNREPSLARVHGDALALPFKNKVFSSVLAFLFDPFNHHTLYPEISRVLCPGGVFFGTLPHPQWGSILRSLRDADPHRASFLHRSGNHIVRRSHLTPSLELRNFLKNSGFSIIQTNPAYLPQDNGTISPDIIAPAEHLGVDVHELPILLVVYAKKDK